MLRIIGLIIGPILCFVAQAMAQQDATAAKAADPPKLAQIDELLAAMKQDRTQKEFLAQIQPALKQQLDGFVLVMPPEVRAKIGPDIQEFEKQISAFVFDRLGFQNLRPDYVRIYDETFSAAEVADLLAFYKSAAGQALVDKLPLIMAKSGALAQQKMKDAAPEMQKMTDVWVEKMKAKYADEGLKK